MAAAEGMMPLVSKSALLSCLATSPKRNCRIKNNETRVLRRFAARLLAVLCLMCLSFAAQAAVCVGSACTVTSAADLVTALTTVDNNPGTSYTVTFTSDVTLAAANTLPAINSTSTITIDGGGHILDGGGVQRGFFVYAGTVTIQNLTIQKAKAGGGIGLAGGGGGAGLGGAIFVTSGAGVTLNNVSLLTNQAAGGNAALAGYTNNGGGGGMGGNSPDVNSGGGGGLGLGADGGNAGPGLPGIVIGAAGGGSSTFAGGASGGGGGYGFSIAGGGGVGGSSASPGVAGGNGGFGGGGGGGGGNGGFGGGGAGAAAFQQPCGAGGFGGGGGGVCNSANPGPGGFGGGGGTNVDGGGGLGAGGAIFVQQGGTLTLTGPLTVNGSTVVGGSSTGHSGLALGSGMFIQGNGTVTFTPSLSQTQTLSDAIADQTGSGGTGGNAGAGGLTKSGAGTLILAGANSYTGGTTVSGGTLQGTTTSLQGNITDNATVVFNQSTSGTYAGIISGSGDITISGSGGAIVTFSGANTYTGATNVLAGTLLVNGSLANTSVTVASGATVCGTGTISGNVTVKAGGTLCATLTVTGTTTTVPTTQAGLLLYVPSVASSTTSVYTTNADGTLTAVTMLPGFAGPYAAAARGDQAFAYITNSLDNTIRVVDTGSNTIVQTLAVGAFPIGVAISPDGKKVYVANHTSNSVSLFSANPVTGLLTAGGAFGPGTAPRQVVVSPDGSRIYVVNQGTGVGIGTIGVFDASTNILLSTVTVGAQPLNAAINPAGTRLYVTNFTDSTVSVIDTGNNTVIATVSTGSSPDGIVVSPDGAHYYVANRTAGTISQFNTSNNAPIAAAIASGSPEGLVVSPDGNALYASDIAANTVKVFGVASGSGALVANGSIAAGTLPLYLSMCRDGNAMLAAGATFVANTVAAIGCAGTTPTFTGGTLLIKGAGLTISSPLTLGSGGGTINPNGNTATISGVIGGSGGLTLNGTGTLVLAAADTYAGGTTVTSGTLQLGAGGGLASSSGLTVNGGVFDLNGQSQNVSALSGSSGGSIALGAGTLTVNQASATTYAGVLSGSGSVIKSGAGVLTLTGASTYSGGTTIAAGTLTVDGSLTNSTVTIDNGATLCGTGTVKNVVVNPGGILCNTVIVSGTLTPAPTTTIVVGSPLLVPPATPQTFTATVAASGIPVPGGTVTFVDATTSTTLATVAVNVAGQASITVTLPGGTQLLQAIYNPAPGYVTSSAATTVTVQQLLAVTVQSVSITYGSAIPALSCAIAGAVQPGDVVTVSCATTATSTSPAGTYAITPRLGGAQAGNYIASGSGTITIVPAMLTITADDFARVVGTANPVFTGVISGIQNNDAVSATYATAATQASVTGTYPIVPSVVGSASILANYSVKTVVGTLTIVASDIVPQTGWWWDPTESGMGFVIERQGTDMFLASVAYNADGAPTWILSNGPVVSSLYVGKLHMYRSGQTLTGAYQPALDDGAQGTIQVQFLDPANAKLTWFGRTITLQRLSFAGGTAGTVQNGWWWNPAESGRGFGIEIEGSAMFMAGLMFNAAGAPTWYLATGPMASATQFTGVWQQYGNGPTFEGCLNPFFGGCGPTIVTNPNAGSVSVTFTDASHGTLTLPDGRQIPIQRLVF